MKAMRFHEYGEPGVLRLQEVDEPAPGPGEARVRVAATSFNPVDAGIRGGFLREVFPLALPHGPGIDVAGTVDALGAEVTDLRVGDAVVGSIPLVADGASAEYVLAPADLLAAAPETIPLADAVSPTVGTAAASASGMVAGAAARSSAGARTYSADAPSATSGSEPTTASPTRRSVTSAPSASTVPATSMPGTCGSASGNTSCRKPPRMSASTGLNDVAATRTRASPGPGAGSSTSWSRRTPGSPY
ncbi:MAG TPA: alcohol dehydrogenase catalytic domain-containing protein, partial [Miltoncostaeaceae bacterium]|nr:alcohol dehydrogenase catalytic domain-containing protein [Miltoncostaeaceae bacterium]